MSDWWKTFFDDDYIRIWGQLQSEENNVKQAAELWSMLDLKPGCQILDAPCGWGRLSRQLALLGATVLGIDESEPLLTFAARTRGEIPGDQLRYLRHDLRTPLPETGFDLACNIFTSFGYGTEEEDLAIFRTLRGAVRQGGRVLVETNHRDLTCARIAHGANGSKRLPDGTLFLADSDFDAISGVVHLNWYWSGPGGAGEKHGDWRCYTPTQITDLLRRSGLHFVGAYKGLSKAPYRPEGPEVGGRLAVVAVRED